MAKQKLQAQKVITPYEFLGIRILRVINHPRSQMSKSVLLERSADDSSENWDRMLAEIAENDNVTLVYHDDGNVLLSWTA